MSEDIISETVVSLILSNRLDKKNLIKNHDQTLSNKHHNHDIVYLAIGA
jgi:hypothetical protein